MSQPAAHPLTTAPIGPTILRLAAPNVVAMMAQALVAIAETAYAGLLGTPQLAGLALAFPFVMLQQMMSAGAMGGGISSAISRALGAGDVRRANALAGHALLIGGCAGVVSTIIMMLAGPAIYAALGGRNAALSAAITYSNVVFLGSLFFWVTNTLASILRGSGNMRAPSLVLLGGALLQTVLSGVLALGLGPIPRFGMAGIAAGQVIAFAASALVLFVLLRRRGGVIRLGDGRFSVDRAMLADILKVGAVAVASPIMSVATVLVVTRLVSQFGTEAIAGYGIGARLEFLLVPIVFAVGVAAVPMVGMAIGSRNIARARSVAWTAGGIAGAATGLIGLIVAIMPELWAQLYSSDPGVLAGAGMYLRIAGPAFAFYGFGLAIYFASQGSGQILGPVLAQAARLATVVVGGYLITMSAAGAGAMFALVAGAMVVYGAASATSLARAKWG